MEISPLGLDEFCAYVKTEPALGDQIDQGGGIEPE